MTYQEIFLKADFEETWKYLHETLEEDERLKPVYKLLISKIIALPIISSNNSSSDSIKIKVGLEGFKFVKGIPDPQEWLLHREVLKDIGEGVEIFPNEISIVAAHLIYWSTLYSFQTLEEQFVGFSNWLSSIENDEIKPIESEPPYLSKSFHNKKLLFWQETIEKDFAFDWSANLGILKKKLEYNIGYWRYVQRHVGWEEDVKRMQTACRLLEIASSDYPNVDGKFINTRNASRYTKETDWRPNDEKSHRHYLKELYRDKAFTILWKYLEHNMKNWWD